MREGERTPKEVPGRTILADEFFTLTSLCSNLEGVRACALRETGRTANEEATRTVELEVAETLGL